MGIAAEDASNSTALRLWCTTSEESDIVHRLRSAAEVCESLGQAFALGIQASIAHLTGARFSDVLCAVAVSEDSGNHPRHLVTALNPTGDLISGHKSFVTLGAAAHLVLVAARDSTGTCRVCVVRRQQPETVVSPLPPLAFAPDLKHARLTFDNAPVQETLSGDGYTNFVKPFRVLEDLYTRLSACEYAASVLTSPPTAVRALLADASSKILVALEGIETRTGIQTVEDALATADAALHAVPPTRGNQRVWARDLRLLEVGASARKARLAKVRSQGET
jgi:acyl-CoA dehydrogenase